MQFVTVCYLIVRFLCKHAYMFFLCNVNAISSHHVIKTVSYGNLRLRRTKKNTINYNNSQLTNN